MSRTPGALALLLLAASAEGSCAELKDDLTRRSGAPTKEQVAVADTMRVSNPTTVDECEYLGDFVARDAIGRYVGTTYSLKLSAAREGATDIVFDRHPQGQYLVAKGYRCVAPSYAPPDAGDVDAAD